MQVEIKSPMTKQQALEWVNALRSGKYKQGKSRLKQKYKDGSTRFCCLGVAADLLKLDSKSHQILQSVSIPYNSSVEMYSYDLFLGKDIQIELAELNDDGKDFEYIADYIESNIIPTLVDQ